MEADVTLEEVREALLSLRDGHAPGWDLIFASRVFLEQAPHKCFFLTRYYLAGFFRHLVALMHVVPRADVRSPAYEAVARFFRQCPPSVSRGEALDHRALYVRLACRQVVSPSGVPVRVRWGRVSGGGAPAAVCDLHWR
ncbi:hypothetical protein AAFF_G00236840 [Aldrovandia affinis]|uniref:Uncharacterized protein n=1 Tax=Aldrovandia affinis TaxID=143900 RepID=A0AAD7RE96_9TELE|nr:hypothetical protein AAFF_G00236840 [Aldrovandia affinis]